MSFYPTRSNAAGATLQWTGGAIVTNGTYYVTLAAPYAGTVASLDYFTGAGSFTAAVQIAGTPIPGLSAVAVNSSTQANVATSGATATAATPITLASATFDTTAAKFGTGALNGGTGTIPYTAIPQAPPYTYECWVKTAAPGSAIQAFFGGGLAGWVAVDTNGYIIGTMGTNTATSTTALVADGAWHHVAFTALSTSSALIFMDGSVAASLTGLAGWGIPTTGAFGVRQYDNSGGGTVFAGEIDELVLTAAAKYTAAFVRPTAPATGAEPSSYAVYHLDGNGAGIAGPGAGAAPPASSAFAAGQPVVVVVTGATGNPTNAALGLRIVRS